MGRRGGKGPNLTVRASHEPTRLSSAHVAAAFEQLVPALERQTRSACAEGDTPGADTRRAGAKPMTDPVGNRDVTSSSMPQVGAWRR